VQGFYGKLPALGDFVRRELPQGFIDPWDDWLQQSIAASKSDLGEAWLRTYLNSPIWRFVLLPGVCGESGWAGILMPSVDKVGRYFPLTIASAVGDNVQPFQIVHDAVEWYDAAETLALTVLHEEKVEPDTLASSVAALDSGVIRGDATPLPLLQGGEWGLRLSATESASIPTAISHELVNFQVGPYSVWWTPSSGTFDAMGLVAPGLPAPPSFSSLLKGRWDEQQDAQDSGTQPTSTELAGESP